MVDYFHLLARQEVDIIQLEHQRLLVCWVKAEQNILFEAGVQSVHDELSPPDFLVRQKHGTNGIAQAPAILVRKIPATQNISSIDDQRICLQATKTDTYEQVMDSLTTVSAMCACAFRTRVEPRLH